MSISSYSVYDSVVYDPVKTKLSESEAEAEEPTNRKAQSRTLSLVYSSASAFDSEFSIDRKRRSHKQNHCSASDNVGLILTRSYRSTVLNTTPTTTPSLVKTSLKEILGSRLRGIRKLIEMLCCQRTIATTDNYFVVVLLLLLLLLLLLFVYFRPSITSHVFYGKHFWCFSTFRTKNIHIYLVCCCQRTIATIDISF